MEHRGNMVMGDTRIEALDNSLFDKLQVFDGDISPMLEPDNNAIAIAVSLDDYGNLPNLEYYPKVGDTITVTYADDVKYIDSRTGELHRRYTGGVLSGKIVWSQRCRVHGLRLGRTSEFHELSL